MSALPPCPQCQSEFAYSTGGELLMCPECGHEWSPSEVEAENAAEVIKDANGTVLQNGDSVIVMKKLTRKGHATTRKSRYQSKEHTPDRWRPQHRM